MLIEISLFFLQGSGIKVHCLGAMNFYKKKLPDNQIQDEIFL